MHRSIYYYLSLLFLSLSCSSSNDPLEIDRWQLSSTISYMTNIETPAEELSFSETVEFVSDGLFLKSRVTDGETVILEGNWQVSELNDQNGFLVRYLEINPLIENCTGGLEEFYFRQDGLLIQNNAIPCDGPEYRYQKGF